MAKKYVNFRVGGSPQKVTDDYSVWTNDLLGKVIASKTGIQPGKSTLGHRLIESDHDQLTYLRVFDRDGWRV